LRALAGSIEDARLLLGHRTVETSQIYAERDEGKLRELAKRHG